MEFSDYLHTKIEYYDGIYESMLRKHDFTNILIRYSEIGTKSRSVQKRMADSLIESIKLLLKQDHIKPTRYYQQRGRLIFSFRTDDIELASFILLQTPGIASISPVIKTSTRISNIKDRVVEYINSEYEKNMEIGIKVRIINHKVARDYKPEDIAELCFRELRKINHQFSRDQQNLGAPDLKINVEIRKNFTYIYSTEISELHSGLPVEHQRASLGLCLNRYHDFDAFAQIFERGQHVIPVLFRTTTNRQYDSLFFDFLRGSYPADEFYVLIVNLEPILSIIKEKTSIEGFKRQDLPSICVFCRYIRYQILENIIHNQIQIIRATLKRDNLKIKSVSNILYDIPNYEGKPARSIKNSRIKTRYIRGIIDSEQDSIYCPYNEDSWKLSAQYGTPIFYPLLSRRTSKIKEHLFSFLAGRYYHNILQLAHHRLQKNPTVQRQLQDQNQRLKLVGKSIATEIGNKICDYREPISQNTKKDLFKTMETLNIDSIVKRALKGIQLQKVF